MRFFQGTGIVTVIFLCFLSAGSAVQTPSGTSYGDNPWNGGWASELYILTIQVNGSTITGSYEPKEGIPYDPGLLLGTVSGGGKAISGTWTETGPITLVLSGDRMSYSGTFGARLDRELQDSDISITNGSRMLPSFDPEHVWSGTWMSPRTTTTLVQNGNAISGSYEPLSSINDEPGLLEGTVSADGKKFSGTWIETGNFSFTLSEDASFFNGTYTWQPGLSAESDSWDGVRMVQ